jgi:hypothetical protein
MIRLPASCAWTAAGLRASMPHGSPSTTDPVGERRARLAGDRGEGVISAAIAVLIVAFLGALMWVGFQTMFEKTQDKTDQQIEKIGQD